MPIRDYDGWFILAVYLFFTNSQVGALVAAGMGALCYVSNRFGRKS